jgi:hypothetical protein
MRVLRSTLVLAMAVALLGAGCASGDLPRRTAPKVILGALVLGGAALAVVAAVKSDAIEKDLREDYGRGGLSGRDFGTRDADGERWNRIGRASAFVGGLSLLGLGVLWEMSLSDRAGQGPAEAPAAQPMIFPAPPSAAAVTLPLPAPVVGAR